jgi:hypothetical protein
VKNHRILSSDRLEELVGNCSLREGRRYPSKRRRELTSGRGKQPHSGDPYWQPEDSREWFRERYSGSGFQGRENFCLRDGAKELYFLSLSLGHCSGAFYELPFLSIRLIR